MRVVGGGGAGRQPGIGSGCAIDSLTTEHGVKAAEMGGERKAICASANTRFDNKGA
jgi:hypothetical protein